MNVIINMSAENESLLVGNDLRAFWTLELSRLYEKRTFADVKIHSGTKCLKVHSCLLAKASPFFKQVLLEQSPADNDLELILDHTFSQAIEAFFRLMYTGEISQPEDKESVQDLCHMFDLSVMELGPDETLDIIDEYDDDEDDDEEDEIEAAAEMSQPRQELTVKLEENLGKSRLAMQRLSSSVVKNKKKRVLMTELSTSELTCLECGKTFSALYKLRLHKLIHSATPPFVCSFCGHGFNNKYKMRGHERQHAQPESSIKNKKKCWPDAEDIAKRIICDKCGAVFDTKRARKEHIMAAHPLYYASNYTCPTCHREFRAEKGLANHVAKGCQKFACNMCPRRFTKSRELKRHASEAHNNHGDSAATTVGRQHFKCHKCSTVCSSRKSLKIHGKTAHLEGGDAALPYKCLTCGKAFLKQSYMEEHYNRFHSTVKPFACMFCPKRCATKQDLDRHLMSHRGEPVFQCSFCPRSFVHRASLKKHQRGHVGEKPYQCLPCSKSYGLLSVLKKHQRSHERKGDQTHLVTAPKGRRGCRTFIDYSGDIPEQQNYMTFNQQIADISSYQEGNTADPTFQGQQSQAFVSSANSQLLGGAASTTSTSGQHQNQEFSSLVPPENTSTSNGLTETESIAMDILGLFNEPHETQTPIENM